jgi:voltage-gated potassium channel Kch
VLALTAAVILVKGLVLFAVAGLFRLKAGDRWLFGLALAPAGEFGFVLLSFSQQNAVIAPDLAKILSLVVALSMLLTPALFVLYSRLVLPRLRDGDDREPDAIEQPGTVIIAGVGRFGQIVNRMLLASSVRTVVLDHEAAILDMLRELGIKAYYGDASRPDLLQAAGIADAAVFVVAIDNRERAVQMVEYVRRNYPQVQIIARAFDVNHLYLLKQAGADVAVREVFDASTRVGSETLRRLGLHPFKVEKMEQAFRRHDAAGLAKLYEVWDEHPDIARNRAYLARAREHGEALKEMMETDRLQLHDRSERGWTPPPKGYTDELDR